MELDYSSLETWGFTDEECLKICGKNRADATTRLAHIKGCLLPHVVALQPFFSAANMLSMLSLPNIKEKVESLLELVEAIKQTECGFLGDDVTHLLCNAKGDFVRAANNLKADITKAPMALRSHAESSEVVRVEKLGHKNQKRTRVRLCAEDGAAIKSNANSMRSAQITQSANTLGASARSDAQQAGSAPHKPRIQLMTRPALRVVVQLEENLREAELLCGKHSETLRIYAPKGKKVDLDGLQNKIASGARVLLVGHSTNRDRTVARGLLGGRTAEQLAVEWRPLLATLSWGEIKLVGCYTGPLESRIQLYADVFAAGLIQGRHYPRIARKTTVIGYDMPLIDERGA